MGGAEQILLTIMSDKSVFITSERTFVPISNHAQFLPNPALHHYLLLLFFMLLVSLAGVGAAWTTHIAGMDALGVPVLPAQEAAEDAFRISFC